jgi:hypothetical protein
MSGTECTEPIVDPRANPELAALARCCRLLAVDLVRIRGERAHEHQVAGPLGLAGPLKVDVEIETAHPGEPPPLTGWAYLVVARCRWSSVGEPAAAVAEVEVAFRVAYGFEGLAEPPGAALVLRFGQDSAVHHAWPFLRERLRGLSAELGLPGFVLPVRRVVERAQAAGCGGI